MFPSTVCVLYMCGALHMCAQVLCVVCVHIWCVFVYVNQCT